MLLFTSLAGAALDRSVKEAATTLARAARRRRRPFSLAIGSAPGARRSFFRFMSVAPLEICARLFGEQDEKTFGDVIHRHDTGPGVGQTALGLEARQQLKDLTVAPADPRRPNLTCARIH